jgi:transposase-like protein
VAFLQMRCPSCQDTDVMNPGRTAPGKQRYRCKPPSCPSQTLLVEYSHHGRLPDGTQQIPATAVKGRGSCDLARALHIRPTTVLEELKKKPPLQHLNNPAIRHMAPREIIIEIHKGDGVEVDEMWSLVGKKTHRCCCMIS